MIIVKIGLSKEKICIGKIYFWTIYSSMVFLLWKMGAKMFKAGSAPMVDEQGFPE
jgi:hypothetical protein